MMAAILAFIKGLFSKTESDISTLSNQIADIEKFTYGGTVPNNTDLNDVSTPGTYTISGNNTHANKPNADCYMLVVFRPSASSNNKVQISFGTQRMYWRFISNTTVQSWTQIS